MLNQFYNNQFFPLFVFIGGWFLIGCIGSLLGGWYTISKKYRRQNVTSRTLFPFASMYIGPMKYTNLLFFRVGHDGLDMSVILAWSLFHPPLLIPWDAFESCMKAPLYFSKRTRLTLKNPKYSLYFDGALADEIEKCYHESVTK
jgi:hypothetical protein